MNICRRVVLASFLPAAAVAQQSLVVDDAHRQMGVPAGQKAAFYTLEPGSQVLVDASHYEFKGRPAQT